MGCTKIFGSIAINLTKMFKKPERIKTWLSAVKRVLLGNKERTNTKDRIAARSDYLFEQSEMYAELHRVAKAKLTHKEELEKFKKESKEVVEKHKKDKEKYEKELMEFEEKEHAKVVKKYKRQRDEAMKVFLRDNKKVLSLAIDADEFKQRFLQDNKKALSSTADEFEQRLAIRAETIKAGRAETEFARKAKALAHLITFKIKRMPEEKKEKKLKKRLVKKQKYIRPSPSQLICV